MRYALWLTHVSMAPGLMVISVHQFLADTRVVPMSGIQNTVESTTILHEIVSVQPSANANSNSAFTVPFYIWSDESQVSREVWYQPWVPSAAYKICISCTWTGSSIVTTWLSASTLSLRRPHDDGRVYYSDAQTSKQSPAQVPYGE